jgi:tritrans,polycis-undecaprenyl-diphosphate synthase [geranylgeranyl-diphosphate specific]
MLRERIRRLREKLLRRRLSQAEVPRHVAMVQDGNRRYARNRGGEAEDGHREGARTTEAVLDWAYEAGVEEVTVYAFSTENFERSEDELESLFDLIADKLDELADSEKVHDRNVDIRAVGDVERLPERVVEAVERVENATSEYDRCRLNVALAYGGRDELLRATEGIAHDVERGALPPEDVDADEIGRRLEVVSDVDLLVRTGGERRTSNFLPWQARGGEAQVYFTDEYWPAFDRLDFYRALSAYDPEQGTPPSHERETEPDSVPAPTATTTAETKVEVEKPAD